MNTDKPNRNRPTIVNLESFRAAQRPIFCNVSRFRAPGLAALKRQQRLTDIDADAAARKILLSLSQAQTAALIEAAGSTERFADHLWKNYKLKVAFSPVARIITILGDPENLEKFSRLRPILDPPREKHIGSSLALEHALPIKIPREE